MVENLDPSNRFVKGSGFASPSAAVFHWKPWTWISCFCDLFDLLCGFGTHNSFFLTDAILWSANATSLMITDSTFLCLQSLLCSDTSFFFCSCQNILCSHLPHITMWRDTSAFVYFAIHVSCVLLYIFLPWLHPSLCVHKWESKGTWYALSQLQPCLGDWAGSSAAVHGAWYNPEKCHPFLLQGRRNCQYNENMS